jgi:hypothetical protein
MDGARLTNSGGTAMYATQISVGSSMRCGEGFTATGSANLDGARIGGQLNFTGATITNAGGTALSAYGLHVDRDMLCDGFTAIGEIDLTDARIGGVLSFEGAKLSNPAGSALSLHAASIRELLLAPRERPDGDVILFNTKVEAFIDTQETWPTVLYLRGFTYDRLENQDVGTRARLRWVKRHPGRFTPQLYDQLAAAYQRAGDEHAVRKVAVTKQWRRRRAFNPLNWLWYATVGYGYRTWLAGIWLAALTGLGAWVFSDAYPAHMVATSTHPPAFHAAAYALDLVLPVISLGQKSAWQPQGSAYQYWSWAFTGAGWVLTTAVVAGLTGILKRD